jgi:DNA-binding GntR family transcriptional regulator
MSLDQSIAARIVELIHAEGMDVGSHLPAQMLADRLRVSRSPVNESLEVLHRKGLLRHEPRRGYFVAKPVQGFARDTVGKLGLGKPDTVARAYFRIAEDRLRGALPDEFNEALLRKRYKLSAAEAAAVLARIAQEGWAEKKPGYGWAFSAMLTTPDALLQAYRMRLALEPAALPRARIQAGAPGDRGVPCRRAPPARGRHRHRHRRAAARPRRAFPRSARRGERQPPLHRRDPARQSPAAPALLPLHARPLALQGSIATSTFRYSTWWSAAATKKPPGRYASTFPAPFATSRRSAHPQTLNPLKGDKVKRPCKSSRRWPSRPPQSLPMRNR